MVERIVEVVHDLKEFQSLLDPGSRIHYETWWKPVSRTGALIDEIMVGVTFYGLSKEGHIVKCELAEYVRWDDARLKKYRKTNLYDEYNEFIKEKWAEYDELAKSIGATKGRFEYLKI